MWDGNNPSICSRTQENQVKPVSKWPVAGPSGYWLLASRPVDILHRIICKILGEGVQAVWTSTVIEGLGIGDGGESCCPSFLCANTDVGLCFDIFSKLQNSIKLGVKYITRILFCKCLPRLLSYSNLYLSLSSVICPSYFSHDSAHCLPCHWFFYAIVLTMFRTD